MRHSYKNELPTTYNRACQQRERKVREAFHIYQRKPQINRDNGIERSAVSTTSEGRRGASEVPSDTWSRV